MLHRLKRHLVPMRAEFEYTLVVIHAFPAERLSGLVPPGLRVDDWNGLGFLAAAFVQTRNLRPAFLPRLLGHDFFLAGYRVFVKHRRPDGRELRGLKILRSDADSALMVRFGNRLTHYNYNLVHVATERTAGSLDLSIESLDGLGNVSLRADLGAADGYLAPGSPFPGEREARRFTGPMPYTFDYERESHSILCVEGVRKHWRPRLVPVAVRRLGFLDRPELAHAGPVLASCFYIEDVSYRWKRGVRWPLETPESTAPRRGAP